MPRISARFRERLRKCNYSVTYYNGPRFECVKRRGHKTEWFMDGVPVSEEAARTRMQALDAARRA
jgi:hypothetical protein